MIDSRKKLDFYLKADEIMNEQVFPKGFRKWINYNHALIRRFLRCMRWLEYASSKYKTNKMFLPLKVFYSYTYHRLAAKTGFDIPINTFGYGVRIGYLSNIVINGATKIGNYWEIQNNITIADGWPKKIGNNVSISSNVVIAKEISIADGCTISSCSFLNCNGLIGNTLWGVKAKPIKRRNPWTAEEPYYSERMRCENLRNEMGFV